MQEEVLFNYKGKDILIRLRNYKYEVGIRSESGIDIWFEKMEYNSLRSARTSGREYARSVIDRMLVARKQTEYDKT